MRYAKIFVILLSWFLNQPCQFWCCERMRYLFGNPIHGFNSYFQRRHTKWVWALRAPSAKKNVNRLEELSNDCWYFACSKYSQYNVCLTLYYSNYVIINQMCDFNVITTFRQPFRTNICVLSSTVALSHNNLYLLTQLTFVQIELLFII